MIPISQNIQNFYPSPNFIFLSSAKLLKKIYYPSFSFCPSRYQRPSFFSPFLFPFSHLLSCPLFSSFLHYYKLTNILLVLFKPIIEQNTWPNRQIIIYQFFTCYMSIYTSNPCSIQQYQIKSKQANRMKSQISVQIAQHIGNDEILGFYNPQDGKFYAISPQLLQMDCPLAHQLQILLQMFSQGEKKSQ